MARSQMQAYLSHQLPYPATDLDQRKPQAVQLHPPRAAFDQLPPQSIHQPVGHRVQEQPKLVGYETVAAQAIRFHVELEVLDPVLCLSSPGVEFVESGRLIISGGYDEARVRPLLHRLGLVDDPALVVPASGFVELFTEEPGLVGALLVALFGFFEQLLGHLPEFGVGYEGDGVGDALMLAVVVEGRYGETRVRP